MFTIEKWRTFNLQTNPTRTHFLFKFNLVIILLNQVLWLLFQFASSYGSSHFPSLFFPFFITLFLPKRSFSLSNSSLLFYESNRNGDSVVQTRSPNRWPPRASRCLHLSLASSYIRFRSPHSFAWVTKFNALQFLLVNWVSQFNRL